MGGKLIYNHTKKSFIHPALLHIELTERCPLKCPQCYCTLAGRDMDFSMLEKIIFEAKELEISNILLTGGEPLLYPHLEKCISLIDKSGMKAIISSSGIGLTPKRVNELYNYGLFNFHISLNGSVESIHNLSRNCYEDAINAIKCIKTAKKWCGINWVARKDNYRDFPKLLHLVQELGVDRLDILTSKYSANDDIQELDENELRELAEWIKPYSDEFILIEICYPKLQKVLFGNQYNDVFNSCLAGKMFMDVHVDGYLSPCRHTRIKDKAQTLSEYWNNSITLQNYRDAENGIPCRKCTELLRIFAV